MKKNSCQVDLWSKENNESKRAQSQKIKKDYLPQNGMIKYANTHQILFLAPEACVCDDLHVVLKNLWLFGSVLND